VVIFTGGGGAGVTTLAAATAMLSASLGSRTHLLAAEHAPLARLFPPDQDRPPGLTLSHADPDTLLGEASSDVFGWMGKILSWAGVNGALASDLRLLPGLPLLAALLGAVGRSEHFDLTVVDSGPATVTLPLLALLALDPAVAEPEAGRGAAARLVLPLAAHLLDLPRPGHTVRDAGDATGRSLADLNALLHDPARLSVRVVLPPDSRAPELECEARTALGLHGIGLDALIRRATEGQASDGETLILPWSDSVPPPGDLARCAATLYGARSPREMLAPPVAPRFEVTETGVDLVIPVPARSAADLAVSQRGERLEVQAGPWRRTFRLPKPYTAYHAARAVSDNTSFRVQLVREDPRRSS